MTVIDVIAAYHAALINYQEARHLIDAIARMELSVGLAVPPDPDVPT